MNLHAHSPAAKASAWVPPLDAPYYPQWALFAEELSRYGVCCPVTTSEGAGAWSTRVTDTLAASATEPMPWERDKRVVRDQDVRDAMIVVDAGVAVQDLYAVAVATGSNQDAGFAADQVIGLASAWFSGRTVRDMVGWVLATSAEEKDLSSMVATVDRWEQAGIAQGWRYAAVGLAVEEVVAGLRDGTLTQDRLSVMAALRGVQSPFG